MALPALAFHDHQPNFIESVNEAQAEAFRLLPGLKGFEFLDRTAFEFKSAAIQVNGLKVGCVSTPDCEIQFGDRADPTLVLPIVGEANHDVGGEPFAFRAHESAVFVPPGAASSVAGNKRSVAVVSFNAKRLENTAATMLGQDGALRQPHPLGRPQAVGLVKGKVSFDQAFRALFRQIDLYSEQPGLLGLAGLDEGFYRTLILATHADALLVQSYDSRTPRDQRRLTRVCEYVMASLDSPITLTDLERIGHMSRKTLHNAFLATYRLAPMQWVREQRLLKARGLLLASSMTVTEVFFASGFTHASQFAALYARRFGELPSVTRKVNR
jgi:AraC-like DNA-binding protein